MKYLLKDFTSKVTGEKLVKLSEDNVAKAEAIMRMMYSSSTSLNKKTENSTKYELIHLFEGTTYQDNYPIYDSIVRIVLPKYLKHYGIERSITDYESYTQVIDEIIKASGASISRNGFDHILWIYYK